MAVASMAGDQDGAPAMTGYYSVCLIWSEVLSEVLPGWGLGSFREGYA
jgi:hypothetical protein